MITAQTCNLILWRLLISLVSATNHTTTIWRVIYTSKHQLLYKNWRRPGKILDYLLVVHSWIRKILPSCCGNTKRGGALYGTFNIVCFSYPTTNSV